jgi:hypothetical protein
MEDFSLFKYYKNSEDNQVPFVFKGGMNHESIYHLGETLKERIQEAESKKSKILSVFVELAQNIKLYSAERVYSDSEDKEVGQGIITFKDDTTAFYIKAGNVIRNESKKELIEKCRLINSLDREELNKLYNKERNRAIEENRAGGNIGLIELARRSRNPLQVSIDQLDDKRAFFTIEVKISKG